MNGFIVILEPELTHEVLLILPWLSGQSKVHLQGLIRVFWIYGVAESLKFRRK